jgi:hypothetical protein
VFVRERYTTSFLNEDGSEQQRLLRPLAGHNETTSMFTPTLCLRLTNDICLCRNSSPGRLPSSWVALQSAHLSSTATSNQFLYCPRIPNLVMISKCQTVSALPRIKSYPLHFTNLVITANAGTSISQVEAWHPLPRSRLRTSAQATLRDCIHDHQLGKLSTMRAESSRRCNSEYCPP